MTFAMIAAVLMMAFAVAHIESLESATAFQVASNTPEQHHQQQPQPAESLDIDTQFTDNLESSDSNMDEDADTSSAQTPVPSILELNFQIYDSLDDNAASSWPRRSRGSVHIAFASTRSSDSSANTRNQVTFNPSLLTFNSVQRRKLMQLATADQLYTIQFVPTGQVNDAQHSTGVLASIPACQLMQSNYHELFTLAFSVYGQLHSVGYSTPLTTSNSATDSDCKAWLASQPPSQLDTDITLHQRARLSFGRQAEPVRFVRMTSRLSAQEAEAAVKAKQDGTAGKEAEQPKSFFNSWYMYVIPILLILTLNAFGPQPEQQGASGAGAAAAAARAR